MVEIPPSPSWETVVEMMYDKHLDAFSDEVVKVIYSKDRSIFRKKRQASTCRFFNFVRLAVHKMMLPLVKHLRARNGTLAKKALS